MIQKNTGGSLSIVVPGDILSTTVATLRREFRGRVEDAGAQWDTLELDLNATRMIDSVGLNLLVAIIREMNDRGSKIILRGACPHVKRTVQFTRLDRYVELA